MSHLETERQASVCGSPSCKTRVGCVHMYTVLELEVGCVFMYITFVAGRLLKVGRSLGMSVSNWVVVVVYFSAWDTKKRPSTWHEVRALSRLESLWGGALSRRGHCAFSGCACTSIITTFFCTFYLCGAPKPQRRAQRRLRGKQLGG